MKKIKRKKNYNAIKTSKISSNINKSLPHEFDSVITSMMNVFKQYSVKDIAVSLFVSSLWLPNIASPVKHQFLTSIFSTLNPKEFSTSNKITSYSNFKYFLQKIYSLLPSFIMLEDFIPETDWGDIRFHHAGRTYRIFYGNELSNVHEYLTLFQMVYAAHDEEYRKVIERSPAAELKYCLQLQEDIISGITSQPDKELKLELSPCHIEIPPQTFWEDSIKFYSSYKPEQVVSESFLNNYSIKSGSWSREYLKWEEFGEMVFTGKVLPAFFIACEDHYFPILPRRYSSILFDCWGKIYKDNYDKLFADGMSHSMHIGAELHRYMKARIRSQVFPFVSAVTSDGLPFETIFSSAFISKDKLILIYIANPAFSKENTEEELSNIIPKLKESIKLIINELVKFLVEIIKWRSISFTIKPQPLVWNSLHLLCL